MITDGRTFATRSDGACRADWVLVALLWIVSVGNFLTTVTIQDPVLVALADAATGAAGSGPAVNL